jgi:hypothetical protein
MYTDLQTNNKKSAQISFNTKNLHHSTCIIKMNEYINMDSTIKQG